MVSKKAGSANKPATGLHRVTYGGNKTARKSVRSNLEQNQRNVNMSGRTYKNIASQVAKSGYRADLRAAAVARASSIRRSQRSPKPEPKQKLRGNAAKRAAEN